MSEPFFIQVNPNETECERKKIALPDRELNPDLDGESVPC